jgi:hypothetical protein
MLGVVLSVIGLICIIISLFYINKISKKEKDIYEEMKIIYTNIKDYSLTIENIINGFDTLIETSLNKMEVFQRNSVHNIKGKEVTKENGNETNKLFEKNILDDTKMMENATNVVYKKIMALKDLGLSKEEIAKKLNIGVREVEIILKMGNNI